MKTIAMIPARAGSKRLPGKNTRDFFGWPVIAFPITVALQSACFNEVMVSTDSPRIAEIACRYAATVPFLRSAAAASDTAGDVKVIREVLNAYAQRQQYFDAFCWIYPVTPLITPEALQEGFHRLQAGVDSVVPVLPDGSDPGQWYWCRTDSFWAYGEPPCGLCDRMMISWAEGQDVNTEADWQALETKYQERKLCSTGKTAQSSSPAARALSASAACRR
jgi:hypothetical protein